MATKRLEVPGVGPVTLYKRRGLKSMRITIRPGGDVRVSLPFHAPFQLAVAFVESKKDWIASHQTDTSVTLENAQQIGKQHYLRFTASFTTNETRSRVTDTDILITHPAAVPFDDSSVQKAAEQAAVRALRNEAEALLPHRVSEVALKTGFEYKSVLVKKLKGRWGSCDQDHNIVLNLYLMQLPWQLIDYVILHELVHTEHLHHGPDFWQTFEQHEPAAKVLRKQIRQYQPNFLLPTAP